MEGWWIPIVGLIIWLIVDEIICIIIPNHAILFKKQKEKQRWKLIYEIHNRPISEEICKELTDIINNKQMKQTSYLERLKAVKTLEELLILREELTKEEEESSSIGKPWLDMTVIESTKNIPYTVEIRHNAIKKCGEINFWLEIITTRIKWLVKQGEHVDQITQSTIQDEQQIHTES